SVRTSFLTCLGPVSLKDCKVLVEKLWLRTRIGSRICCSMNSLFWSRLEDFPACHCTLQDKYKFFPQKKRTRGYSRPSSSRVGQLSAGRPRRNCSARTAARVPA